MKLKFVVALAFLFWAAMLVFAGGGCLNNCRSIMNKCKHVCKGNDACILSCIYNYQTCAGGCPQ